MRNARSGFTLVELIIVVAVIAILAAMALPAYQGYVRRAAYTELIGLAVPVKRAISACMDEQSDPSRCSTAEQLGIQMPAATAALASMSIDAATLAIRLVPSPYRGLSAADYCDLRPVLTRANRLEGWGYDPSSPCVTQGYVHD